ncbi:hypothetical protein OD350_10140 [Clostridium beijerinckii]|uniref:hypothetical protein n=1 Tax=Clostridium beijerinckii TaxID=1520 RepID=UPI00222741D5|nr:hypothetical protein [Clostridium beijerinckii]UYZ38004.1 hypothetical protein OD350_10140 [Clostridium beijerinckii]
MIMRIPINFDSSIHIKYEDGSTEDSLIFPGTQGLKKCTFNKMNGYDYNNNRVTNLVGYDGQELIKRCPCCMRDKHVTEFGYSGRITNRKRDQSQCTNCRGSY